jgi:hypothetical protein
LISPATAIHLSLQAAVIPLKSLWQMPISPYATLVKPPLLAEDSAPTLRFLSLARDQHWCAARYCLMAQDLLAVQFMQHQIPKSHLAEIEQE